MLYLFAHQRLYGLEQNQSVECGLRECRQSETPHKPDAKWQLYHSIPVPPQSEYGHHADKQCTDNLPDGQLPVRCQSTSHCRCISDIPATNKSTAEWTCQWTYQYGIEFVCSPEPNPSESARGELWAIQLEYGGNVQFIDKGTESAEFE